MSKSAATIVVFVCNWDGLSCVEKAAQARLLYPASVRLVRVSCLSRVHSGLMLKAFELGADGVMLLGCEPGRCHFDTDAECVAQEYEKVRGVLGLLGVGRGRLVLACMPRGDGSGFVSRLLSFIAEIEQTQPATHAERGGWPDQASDVHQRLGIS
jgi:coenzyme F420-reducing hydrogenase delta subunit